MIQFFPSLSPSLSPSLTLSLSLLLTVSLQMGQYAERMKKEKKEQRRAAASQRPQPTVDKPAQPDRLARTFSAGTTAMENSMARLQVKEEPAQQTIDGEFNRYIHILSNSEVDKDVLLNIDVMTFWKVSLS